MAKIFGNAPPVGLTGEAAWVLRRAFSRNDTGILPGFQASAAYAFARRHSLAGRVAGRTTSDRLVAELGSEVARGFQNSYQHAAVEAMRAEAAVKQIAEVAHALSVPVVLLKGVALHVSRLVGAGSRPLSDIDILCPPAGAVRLSEELVRLGWTRASCHEEAHPYHIEPIVRTGMPAVEIHFLLPNIVVDATGWAGVDALSGQSLLETVKGLPGVWVPTVPVLAAHALSHAFSAHWQSPNSFPHLKAIADLVDLGGVAAIEDDLPRILHWTGCALPPERTMAVLQLVRCLETGIIPMRVGNPPERRILDYALAGRENQEFIRMLLAGAALRRFNRIRVRSGLAKALWSTLVQRPDKKSKGKIPEAVLLRKLGSVITNAAHLVAKLTVLCYALLALKALTLRRTPADPPGTVVR